MLIFLFGEHYVAYSKGKVQCSPNLPPLIGQIVLTDALTDIRYSKRLKHDDVSTENMTNTEEKKTER